jgi:hypothetical protein
MTTSANLTTREKEALELLRKRGTVATSAPGPTYLARSLWGDNRIEAQDERALSCAALIRMKRIRCVPSMTEATASYRCATTEELHRSTRGRVLASV